MLSNDPNKRQEQKNGDNLADVSVQDTQLLRAKEFLSRVVAAVKTGECRPDWLRWSVAHPQVPYIPAVDGWRGNQREEEPRSNRVVDHTRVTGTYEGVYFIATLERESKEDQPGTYSSFGGKYTANFAMGGKSIKEAGEHIFEDIDRLCLLCFDHILYEEPAASCAPEQVEDFKKLLDSGHNFGWAEHMSKNSTRSYPAGDQKIVQHTLTGIYGDTEVTACRIASCQDQNPREDLHLKVDYKLFFTPKGESCDQLAVDTSENARVLFEKILAQKRSAER